jgi:hypothetical protein
MRTQEKPKPDPSDLITKILKFQEEYNKRVQLKELVYAIVD